MARKGFILGHVVKASAAVVAMALAFSWQSSAVSQAVAAAPAGAAGDVWSATAAANGKPADVGKDIGKKLKDACKDRKPDIILIFQFLWTFKTDEERKQVLDGVAESFDKKIIYGQSTGPISDSNGSGSVVAMALGGVQQTPVNAKIEAGKEGEAYKTLAEGLKAPYTAAAGKGRLVLILGACEKTTKAKSIVDVFQGALGKDVPLFGPGSPGVSHFYQGDVQEKGLTAVLLTGNFTCDFIMTEAPPGEKAGSQDPVKIVESSEKGIATVIGDKKDNIAAILAASFTTRGHTIEHEKGKKEEVAVSEAAKAVSSPLLFIWDYTCEIAIPRTGEPAVGTTGNHFIACVIRKAAAK
ncbi:MAG: hypothetical protein HZA50_04885 [Planctomycetes bacterium]|nr:hypothetical protein [Planctomycetota bacterium]